MRYVLVILFFIIVVILCFGFYIQPTDFKTGEFCIGISVIGIFFVWMPLFIYHRWKGKDVKDYMLTKENMDKMKQEGEDKDL